jgi:hypothetical protein
MKDLGNTFWTNNLFRTTPRRCLKVNGKISLIKIKKIKNTIKNNNLLQYIAKNNNKNNNVILR